MRTTPAPSNNPETPAHGTHAVSGDDPANLYELWEPEELRRHVAILEDELSRMAHAQAELEELRRWKIQVENSRAWRVASILTGIRRFPSRIGRTDLKP